MRKITASIACSIALTVVAAVPGFAQSDDRVRLEARHLPSTVYASPVMRVYDHSVADAGSAYEVPANLSFPPMLRELIESMLQRSPTFRRQCRRLAHAIGVRVQLRTTFPAIHSSARARTDIIRSGHGGLLATVLIQRLEALTELIAHELEHVIEQIDGVDLLAQSNLPGTGVRTCVDGTFETIRAERIGTLVALEMRDHR
jgi:hypothetical protein